MNRRWVGCAAGNFRTGRPAGFLPTGIIIHRSGGSLGALRSRFGDPSSLLSSHYAVGLDGTVEQYVAEGDTAYHAGMVLNPSWPGLRPRVNPNFYTIGIDHEGRAGDPWPATQREATADLLAEIAGRWSIALDGAHVVPHSAIRASANCPGIGAPLNEILGLAANRPEAEPPSTDAMELASTAPGSVSHGGQPRIDRTTLALPSSQYYPVETKKDLLILHFTAGGSARSAVETWKATPEHVATAYVVDLDGTIYEVFPPSCWAYHLGIKGGTVHERRSIGIEIVNVGPLQPAGEDRASLNWWPRAWGTKYCGADESNKFVEAAYRGKRYFAAFPEAQVEAVSGLVRHLCDQFGLERRMPARNQRLDCDPGAFAGYTGIATHANFRPDKWDIGPAFNWDRLGV